MEEDLDRLLEDIWPFGMAMLSNDIVESLNMFLKEAFQEHTAWGSGKQKAIRHTACGLPKASINSNPAALEQVLQWVFLFFQIHRHQHDVVHQVSSVSRACLEDVSHAPPSLPSSLLSSAPHHGWRCA